MGFLFWIYYLSGWGRKNCANDIILVALYDALGKFWGGGGGGEKTSNGYDTTPFSLKQRSDFCARAWFRGFSRIFKFTEPKSIFHTVHHHGKLSPSSRQQHRSCQTTVIGSKRWTTLNSTFHALLESLIVVFKGNIFLWRFVVSSNETISVVSFQRCQNVTILCPLRGF